MGTVPYVERNGHRSCLADHKPLPEEPISIACFRRGPTAEPALTTACSAPRELAHSERRAFALIRVNVLAVPALVLMSLVLASSDAIADEPFNPLQQFFETLLPPDSKEPVPEKPERTRSEPTPYDVISSDPLDGRAPHDSASANWLKQAYILIQDEDWERAARLISQVLERAGGRVVRLRSGEISPVATEAAELFSSLPAEIRREYRLRDEGVAAAMLRDAVAQGRSELLTQISERYAYTPAGASALTLLIARHIDHGRFALAARLLERQRRRGSAGSISALSKAVFAATASGEDTSAQEIIETANEDWQRELGRVAELGRQFRTKHNAGSRLPLADWRYDGGVPVRNARAPKCDPLLLARWDHPLTFDRSVAERIELLEGDVRQTTALVPVCRPIAVRGNIVFRTLRGLSVVSAETGRLIWESSPANSLEAVLAAGDSTEAEDNPSLFQNRRSQFDAWVENLDINQYPATSFLYRDDALGALSSDGARVFTIEKSGTVDDRQADLRRRGARSSRRTTLNNSLNQLAAYDLRTGRVLWRAGGTAVGDVFDGDLAGCHFFGPCLPDDGELLVVGEKDREIRLYALDPISGTRLWSTLLAYSETGIEQDPARARWAAPVAVKEGVIVCPTTLGWVAAVNRVGRRLLWAGAVKEADTRNRSRFRRQVTVTADKTIGQRWLSSPPVINGSNVIIAVPEEDSLICLDLFDGTVRWKKPRGSALAFCGTAEGLVFLTSSNLVVAIDAADGTTEWRVSLSNSNDRTAGGAFLAGDQLLLPLDAGRLWVIDPMTGKVLARRKALSGGLKLGSLVSYKDRLYSLSSQGMTAFENPGLLDEEIRRAMVADDEQAEAKFRQAQLLMLDQKFESALGLLGEIDAAAPGPVLRNEIRFARIAALKALISTNPVERADLLPRLRSISESDAELRAVDIFEIEIAVASGNPSAAVNACLAVARNSDLDAMLPRPDRYRVRLGNWLAGQIRGAYFAASLNEQRKIDSIIEREIRNAEDAEGNDGYRLELADLFAFRPSGQELRLRVAKRLAEAGRHEEAFAQLDHIQDAARGAADRKSPGDDAVSQAGDARFSKELADRVERFRQELADAQASAAQIAEVPAGWEDYEVAIKVEGYTRSTGYVSLAIEGATADFFQRHSFQVDTSNNRLIVLGPNGSRVVQSYSLRSGERSYTPRAKAVGNRIYLLYNDFVHCIAVREARMLWARGPSDRRNSSRLRSPGRRQTMTLLPFSNFANSKGLIREAKMAGIMPVANERIVCVQSLRTLEVFDALSGRLLWARDGLSSGSTVTATTRAVFLLEGGSEWKAFDAINGRPLALDQITRLVNASVATVGPYLVVAHRGRTGSAFGIFPIDVATPRLFLFDPVAGQSGWVPDVPLASAVRVGLLADGRMVLVDRDNSVALVDFHERSVSNLGDVPASLFQGNVRSALCFSTTESLFLIVNRGNQYTYYSGGVPTFFVDGQMTGLALDGSGQRWSKRVKGTLPLSDVDRTPVFIFIDRSLRQKFGTSYWTADITAVDRHTGDTVGEASMPGRSHFNPSAVRIDLQREFVELQTYNGNLRFSRFDKEPAEESEPGEGSKSAENSATGNSETGAEEGSGPNDPR
ncbi:outer membrane protein assembly factor BamB family protein [Stratiformator vulcanicus]|uniref:Outer membrane biogenesis protein BamB n=1 Tax=Stratiformator vulcanicus TaxID=2527980 RepID=A0A517R6A6_9PLAN|nr:PQQ-binding-like beta-propeller repeat protein [Stratiformator vulcanicus]QDT39426.1 outer membrane biogenesis protein BamB [Stratiformator vulcanicus]